MPPPPTCPPARPPGLPRSRSRPACPPAHGPWHRCRTTPGRVPPRAPCPAGQFLPVRHLGGEVVIDDVGLVIEIGPLLLGERLQRQRSISGSSLPTATALGVGADQPQTLAETETLPVSTPIEPVMVPGSATILLALSGDVIAARCRHTAHGDHHRLARLLRHLHGMQDLVADAVTEPPGEIHPQHNRFDGSCRARPARSPPTDRRWRCPTRH